MSKKCPYCGSIRIATYPSGDVSVCLACESFLNTVNGKSKQTVFDRITASPAVLARSLCGNVRVGCFSGYYSMLTGRYYPDMEEAIAATVAKLKGIDRE